MGSIPTPCIKLLFSYLQFLNNSFRTKKEPKDPLQIRIVPARHNGLFEYRLIRKTLNLESVVRFHDGPFGVPIAQLVEHHICNVKVVCSIHTGGMNIF